MAFVRVYALETDGKKYLIWCSEGSWVLESVTDHLHLKQVEDGGGDAYVYPAPVSGSTIVYDNGIDRREFIFAEGKLVPRE